MGIDYHVYKFLEFVRDEQPFGECITIGRQAIKEGAQCFIDDEWTGEFFCEELLKKKFGAVNVDSIDADDFEGASHIVDMNEELPDFLIGQYDTVIDAGCLEHIYNFPQAIQNCSKLLKPGGQIVHVLPSNNFCGHGFYQFSPELFLSLYTPETGYTKTQCFLASLKNQKYWFQVKPPSGGKRLAVKTNTSCYLLVRAVRNNQRFDHTNINQSDYIYEWERSTHQKRVLGSSKLKEKLKKYPYIKFIKFAYYALRRLYEFASQKDKLGNSNPGLIKFKIADK